MIFLVWPLECLTIAQIFKRLQKQKAVMCYRKLKRWVWKSGHSSHFMDSNKFLPRPCPCCLQTSNQEINCTLNILLSIEKQFLKEFQFLVKSLTGSAVIVSWLGFLQMKQDLSLPKAKTPFEIRIHFSWYWKTSGTLWMYYSVAFIWVVTRDCIIHRLESFGNWHKVWLL